MIFGGVDFDTTTGIESQISIVESCGLRRVGTLPMVFTFGACNTFIATGGNEEVLLCFNNQDKLCYR